MKNMETIRSILSWLITLLVPIVLILIGVRIMLSPIFIQVEYRLPYFPDDPYGFTLEERLNWADLSRKYILNLEGIEFLGELRFPDGEQATGTCENYLPPRDCSYLYNDRELIHMYDAKVIARSAMLIMWGALLGFVMIGFWASRSGWLAEFKRALSRGGWLTVLLIVLLLVYVAINFNSLFVTFHKIFFEGSTWIFKFSDSLIRLFPVVFWRDAFIWIGVIALLSGAALGYFLRQNQS
jgi:integral membrane protein (TIGR01906 family)